jgi:hypothetical protein
MSDFIAGAIGAMFREFHRKSMVGAFMQTNDKSLYNKPSFQR